MVRAARQERAAGGKCERLDRVFVLGQRFSVGAGRGVVEVNRAVGAAGCETLAVGREGERTKLAGRLSGHCRGDLRAFLSFL